MNRRQLLGTTALSLAVAAGNRTGPLVRAAHANIQSTTPVWGHEVVAQYPHDPDAYTQGLVYIGDGFFEGTGQYGESDLRETSLPTGGVLREAPLPEDYFGEGIALVDDHIYQITWQEQTAFVYNRDTFEDIDRFSYEGEGWGLTWNGEHLVMSNGSSTIIYRDPETFLPVREIEVFDGDLAIDQLNELEWLDGEIWANVYYTDWIARIDPESGTVNSWVDLQGLLPLAPGKRQPGVLNGIASDPDSGRLFVTGKYWPLLFEIELVEQTSNGRLPLA